MNEAPPGYLGAEGRVGSGPSDALVNSGYQLEIEDAPFLHRGLGLADLAHILELLDIQVIAPQTARDLCVAVLVVLDTPAESFPYDALYGDAYNSRERELERSIGAVAGWLPTGRTRREAGRIAFRLALRSGLLNLHRSVSGFAAALLDGEREYADAPWNDTTYLQPAQPSSFGHFLGGFAEEAVRNLERIEFAYQWANRSPAGSGGVAGTGVPLDRSRLSDRLGFEKPTSHTRDGMWSVDGLTDALVAATQSVITADRLSEDLEIFASPQFGYVTLAGSSTRASVLLPQKRNPYALSVIRGGAGTLIGRTAGLMATQRTPSARTDNWLYAYGEVIRSIDTAQRLMQLAASVVESMDVDREALAASAGNHFSTSGDLTEHIVLTHGLDYRSAYRIVGKAVANAMAHGRGHLSGDDLSAAAQELGLSVPSNIDETVEAMKDVEVVLEKRNVEGGSALVRIKEHCEQLTDTLATHRSWATDARARAAQAESTLVAAAQQLAQGGD